MVRRPNSEPGGLSRRWSLRRLTSLGRRLADLPVCFLRSFFGPVFEVDLRSCSRQRRTYFLRVVYLGLLTFAVAVAWQQAIATARFNPTQGRLSLGMLAPTLLVVCGWFQLIGLTLLGPALTSSAILLERTRRTLPALLTTPLTAWNIVASKLMGRSMQLLVLSALSLPVMASVQAFGGVETVDVLGTMGLGITNGLFAASVGLAVSTHAKTPQRATLTSYCVLAGVYLLVPAFIGWAALFVVFVLGALFTPWLSVSSAGIAMVAAVNPFASMAVMHAEVLSPGTWGIGGLWGGKLWLWVPNVLLLLAGTWVMLVVAAGRLRRLAETDPTMQQLMRTAGRNVIDLKAAAAQARSQLEGHPPGQSPVPVLNQDPDPRSRLTKGDLEKTKPPPDETETVADHGSRGMAKIGAMLSRSDSRQEVPQLATFAVRQEKSRPVGDDPILWRELHRRRHEQSGWSWVALGISAYLLLLVYLPAGFSGSWSSGGFHGVMTTIYLVVLLVATTAHAAPSIAVEKEASCWPLLMGTPLTGWQILSSKGKVVLRRVLPFSLFLIGHLLFFTLFGFLHPIVLLHGLMILAAAVLFTLIVGMWLSLKVKGSTRATAATFLVGLFLWLLLPALVNGFEEITRSGTAAAEATLLINPFYWMLNACAEGNDAYYQAITGVTRGGFTLILFFVSVSYLLVAGALLAYFVRRFNRIVGRTS